MLVLGRCIGERIHINTTDGEITVMVCAIDGIRCRVGIEAPKCCAISRDEMAKATGEDDDGC